ncbi:hemolysin family protein [soil metagenome]
MIFFWAFIAAVILSAVFATLSHAVSAVPRTSVEELAEARGSDALRARLDRILDDWTGHARSLGFLKLICDLTAVLAATAYSATLRHPALADAVLPAPDLLDALFAVAASSPVLWLVSLVLPMSIARHAGARVVYSRSLILRGADMLLSPLRSVGRFSDEVVRRLAGVEHQDAEEQVEAELLSVIEEGQATGALGAQERDMLEAVVQFRDLTVQQIMTPRTEMEALQVSNDLGGVIRVIRALGHSRIPVYDESLDNILGIFYVKDLMHWLGDGARTGKTGFELKSILRPAIFVPMTKTVQELLKELMDKKVHIALVADEYGGTAGLVTIEDIVEEIFGEIRDEYEPTIAETPDVVLKHLEREADLDAAARIADVNDQIEKLGVQLPVSEDYDTVGGFVTTTLGRIPQQGESFEHENMAFKIIEAKPTRVVRVHLSIKSDAAPRANGAAKDAVATEVEG